MVKQVVRLNGLNDIRIGTPAHPPTYPPPPTYATQATAIPTPLKSVADCTFEQYQAANLSVSEKHSLIGELRDEMPIMDRDEIDELTLRELSAVVERCIFPTCKMMQIDPVAVKRMLDDQFRKAYGVEAETNVLGKLGLGRLEDFEKTTAMQRREAAAVGHVKLEVTDNVTLVGDGGAEVKTPASKAPPNKKMKQMPLNNTQKDIKAYVTRRKRGRHGVKVVCLRSGAVCEKWVAMESTS
ncbi:hypothetical protein CFE70_009417 [Pyrenophora teres f. teres 0-1]|uniref:Uncharacterized protein n=1 Tax=Pyrenophora teres f. teres (strain 0-1) TaxID=861557 RepID=E3RN90_PYRTT|nr:hypothetical protein PTT_10026 [Pyrenophora teres f. teres 0-1]KAE8827300.1 hypothetical protein PTNB85_08653 [Pyrenophora teres f. teres]KAE8857807.1 hypothetical protein PTNB73_09055 [Pyrenophora teres f. teres]